MVGPFKTARGGMPHLLVAIDKFTKWIEARPIKKLYRLTVIRFVKDIVGALAQYCSVSGIRLDLASVAHPQSDGQFERENDLILAGIKPRLIEPLLRSLGS
ncbi:uncharacterized protein [Aegilops tauschii subsp. strangulata]|uniref:uncharacterized protein n=1 Tax=Aegilops tauschii subsp. strangulata TaxID=200361 RepID=UPI003CC883B0